MHLLDDLEPLLNWTFKPLSTNREHHIIILAEFNCPDEIPILVVYDINASPNLANRETLPVHRRYPSNKPDSLTEETIKAYFFQSQCQLEDNIRRFLLEKSPIRLQLLTQGRNIAFFEHSLF